MNNMEHTKISIVVPIYKVEKELHRCINSLIAQTYEDIEIILVDDGSPDMCPQICDEYAQNDNRIIVIHKENGGLSDARNAGLRIAKGEYILYVDSDDYIESWSCEKFVQVVEKYHPDIVVANAVQIEGDKQIRMSHDTLNENTVYSAEAYISRAIKTKQWYAPAWLNLYRKEFLFANNLFFHVSILHEDMEILPRVFLSADSIVYADIDFYHYIIRPDSIMKSDNHDKHAQHLLYILGEWKSLFDLIENVRLRRLLYGILVKHYLHICRKYRIKKEMFIDELTPVFMIKYGLDAWERIKVFAFICTRNLFYRFRG